MSTLSAPPAKRPRFSWGLVAVIAFLAAFPASCLGTYTWTVSAPPIRHAVALVESDPQVAEALGGPVSVSLVLTRTLRRDLVQAMQGADRVTVLTRASGSKGEAWLRLSAESHDGQGWAGTFSLNSDGRRVLENGAYRTEGAGTLIEGDFAPDGTARARGR